ncbi:uncharacterized protein [Paramormyrops kingsleyae]|uniref:uncharacterized protein isoform X1 n=1 Tax=Paramormyrops kingsleyae TaxID=1676925 RepID=UPI003B9788D8
MSGCGGGLIGAVSKGTEEEVADCRQERKEPSQGDEERLQSEENDKLLINSKQNGLTWILVSGGADATPSPYSQLRTLAAHLPCEHPVVLSACQAGEDPTDPWNQDGPTPLTLIPSPWDYQWEEMLMEALPLSDRSSGLHPADLTTGALTAKLIQVALDLLPRPVSAPLDMVWVYTAEPPPPALYPTHTGDFLLHSAAVAEDLVKSLEGLHYSEGRRASGGV